MKDAAKSSIKNALSGIEKKWKNLGNGSQVAAKFDDAMEQKLDELVKRAKNGNWKREFEETVVKMLTHGYSSNGSLMWYGHLITQCEIKRDLRMPSPAGVRFSLNKYTLFINPLMFGLYTMEGQIAILKHEMLHIVNLHIMRQKNRDHKLWNYGTDTAINQLIENIPEDGLQPEKFKLERNLNAEQYYELIPKSEQFQEQQKNQEQDGEGGEGKNQSSSGSCQMGGGDPGSESEASGKSSGSGSQNDSDKGENGQQSGSGDSDSDVIDSEQKLKELISNALNQLNNGLLGDHSKWQESEGNETNAKEIARQMAETASEKSRGHVPSEVMNALQLLKMREQFDWKKELRRIAGNRKAFSRSTIKRKDRRMPQRDDLRGKTKDHVCDILIVLDVSGSMSNEELLYGLNEARAIATKARAGVKIIQVDTEPKEVEDFDPKATTFTRRASGGTYLYPAIKYAMEKKIRFDGCVFITDGYIEHSWDDPFPKKPYIWLVTRDANNLSLNISDYPFMKKYTLKINERD